MTRNLFVAAMLVLVAGCVSFPKAPIPVETARIDGDAVISVDSARLGLTQWRARNPYAVIVAIHGMNDYAGAFFYAGPYWAERGISVYAYDQRGFGRSPDFGEWPGAATLEQDLRAVIAAVRRDNPDLPVFVVAHSMGAGVAMAAINEAPLDVDGVVFAAPGVWGGGSMSILYRVALNSAAMLTPGKTLTGERTGRLASDNIEFLRAMYDDAQVIKDTRLDAILGAVRIMGDGWKASKKISGRFLYLYGAHDQIIPEKVLEKASMRLSGDVTIRRFPDGWHLLFADKDREMPLGDVVRWIDRELTAGQMDASTGSS
ncbi:MAG: alpha/beta fold hydrolase [Parvularculaceae bacterium]